MEDKDLIREAAEIVMGWELVKGIKKRITAGDDFTLRQRIIVAELFIKGAQGAVDLMRQKLKGSEDAST